VSAQEAETKCRLLAERNEQALMESRAAAQKAQQKYNVRLGGVRDGPGADLCAWLSRGFGPHIRVCTPSTGGGTITGAATSFLQPRERGCQQARSGG
jgi:hypothetical protein